MLEHQNFEYYLINHRKPAGKRNRQCVGWRERMRGRGDGGEQLLNEGHCFRMRMCVVSLYPGRQGQRQKETVISEMKQERWVISFG